MTGRLQTWCAYSLYLHPSCAQISTFHVQQIYSYKRINKFSRQFFLKFRVPKSRSRDLGSSKLAYMMLLIIVVYPKFNFSVFNRFLITSKSINFSAHLSKWPSKNKSSTRAREVPIKYIKSNCNCNWLLFQTGNCNLFTFFAR